MYWYQFSKLSYKPTLKGPKGFISVGNNKKDTEIQDANGVTVKSNGNKPSYAEIVKGKGGKSRNMWRVNVNELQAIKSTHVRQRCEQEF